MKKLIVIMAFLCLGNLCFAQNILGRSIQLDVNQQRLDQVLEIMSNQGSFYFSYNSRLLPRDSLVSVQGKKTVKEFLDILLPGFEFVETGNYLIIRRPPVKVKIMTAPVASNERFYYVMGYVLDEQTALWIQNASVYEKDLLASALTNQDGYFKLKLKQRKGQPQITVSKEFYRDTSFTVNPGFNQELTVTLYPETGVTIISPDDYFAPDILKLRVRSSDTTYMEYSYLKTDSMVVESTAMGRFLLSARQKVQTMNLKKFFTTRPFQISFTPGLGTHGRLSPQVINHFSLNILGGYNGGVDGFEVGGLFNINKKDVQYFQAAGVFNLTGGRMNGFQVAGVNNTVLDSVSGAQVAGVNNMVKGNFTGFQTSGVYNHVRDSMKGVQISGVGNYAGRRTSGVQVAGVANVTMKEMHGVQISGVVNYAKHVKGLQIGLINVSDTSEGLGIGLINIVRKGYHKLALYTDEVLHANAAFKTGSTKLYNILLAGMNIGDSNKAYSFGYGLGHEILLGKRFTINPELTAQHIYLGDWDHANILSRLSVNFNLRLHKHVALFGGPVLNGYYAEQDVHHTGYRKEIPPSAYKTFDLFSNVKGWLGWNAGISFF